MQHVRNLSFEAKPDYKKMKQLFDSEFLLLNGGKQAEPDQKFDWIYQKQNILERKKEE